MTAERMLTALDMMIRGTAGLRTATSVITALPKASPGSQSMSTQSTSCFSACHAASRSSSLRRAP